MKRLRPSWVLSLLALAFLGAVLLGFSIGSVHIGLGTTFKVLLKTLGFPFETAPEDEVILLLLRLPRVAKAALVGGGLALSGVLMQAVFRNPLADPALLGVSSGGALAAVIALSLGAAFAGAWTVPLVAFVGAVAASAAVLAIGGIRRKAHLLTLLLGGLAVNAMAAALISLILLRSATSDEVRTLLFWLMGSVESQGWTEVTVLFFLILAGGIPAFLSSRALNLLLLDDAEAQSLGLAVRKFRLWMLVINALVAGAAVAVSGVIGFIGLMVPHMGRRLTGPDHHRLLPVSILGGAILLIGADLISRSVVGPVEIRVGIVMALLGAPVFLILLLSRKGTRELL